MNTTPMHFLLNNSITFQYSKFNPINKYIFLEQFVLINSSIRTSKYLLISQNIISVKVVGNIYRQYKLRSKLSTGFIGKYRFSLNKFRIYSFNKIFFINLLVSFHFLYIILFYWIKQSLIPIVFVSFTCPVSFFGSFIANVIVAVYF